MHHDKAPAHKSMLVRLFLAINKTVNMPQPPYLAEVFRGLEKNAGISILLRLNMSSLIADQQLKNKFVFCFS